MYSRWGGATLLLGKSDATWSTFYLIVRYHLTCTINLLHTFLMNIYRIIHLNLHATTYPVIFAASGLWNSKETAQEYVLTGVGLLSGSSILLLTLLWGTCLIVGSRDLKDPNPSSLSSTPTLSLLTGSLSSLSPFHFILESVPHVLYVCPILYNFLRTF